MDEIGEINYLQDHDDDDMSKAAKEAFDKVLGFGHGLTMKVYYGHDERHVPCRAPSSSGRLSRFGALSIPQEGCFVSMRKVDPTLRGGDKYKIDALILKALAIFGLDVNITEEGKEQPEWIMATTCALYR